MARHKDERACNLVDFIAGYVILTDEELHARRYCWDNKRGQLTKIIENKFQIARDKQLQEVLENYDIEQQDKESNRSNIRLLSNTHNDNTGRNRDGSTGSNDQQEKQEEIGSDISQERVQPSSEIVRNEASIWDLQKQRASEEFLERTGQINSYAASLNKRIQETIDDIGKPPEPVTINVNPNREAEEAYTLAALDDIQLCEPEVITFKGWKKKEESIEVEAIDDDDDDDDDDYDYTDSELEYGYDDDDIDDNDPDYRPAYLDSPGWKAVNSVMEKAVRLNASGITETNNNEEDDDYGHF